MNSRHLLSVVALAAALLLSSCGNKGPLVLPQKNAAPDGTSQQVKSS
ncbi:MAG: lipoprotein [Rhodocyclaceae bacterium]|jgi:predicted small lipoprotein YifL|nr:lipoprotein [Rhodocyclaceae bacterium]